MTREGNGVAATLGSGAHRYRVETQWARLPEGWTLGDVSSVSVDARDDVYVFRRADPAVLVFDRGGNLLRAWGEGWFRRPHGIHAAPDGCVYVTDDHAHFVRKCTPEGRVLLEEMTSRWSSIAPAGDVVLNSSAIIAGLKHASLVLGA